MDLHAIIKALGKKRPIFHSEADFQFSLAWELKNKYSSAEIRLERPPVKEMPTEKNTAIDIIVLFENRVYPIEMKYKTKKYSEIINGESFELKNHGAQDLGKYDFVKDVCRLEKFAKHHYDFKSGYAIWITNDESYWKKPLNIHVGYASFSVHDGAVKEGRMSWGDNLSKGTIKGREDDLVLMGKYKIKWHEYNNFNHGFKYAIVNIVPELC